MKDMCKKLFNVLIITLLLVALISAIAIYQNVDNILGISDSQTQTKLEEYLY